MKVEPMKYEGKYQIFNTDNIRTYPLEDRKNKVKLKDLVVPSEVLKKPINLETETLRSIEKVADEIINAAQRKAPVILITGAHLVKNGLSPLIIDLMEKEMITLLATNGAGVIHDFELALAGQTSEDVPNALAQGKFGMAYEFCYINQALRLGDKESLGYGESLGRMICDSDFRNKALAEINPEDSPIEFTHPEISLIACSYSRNIPLTVHASIGTDVTDQHPGFDAGAKGACSGRDFLIFVNEIKKMARSGGVVLNIGSAVTGPEVLLKAVSMVSNVGSTPFSIFTADFDLRPYRPEVMSNEAEPGYYYRDQKSVVTRIPESFKGKGLYIQGNQKLTIPYLYKCIIDGKNRRSIY